MLSESLSGLIPSVMRFEPCRAVAVFIFDEYIDGPYENRIAKVSLNPYDFMIRTSEDITARDLLEKILFFIGVVLI